MRAIELMALQVIDSQLEKLDVVRPGDYIANQADQASDTPRFVAMIDNESFHLAIDHHGLWLAAHITNTTLRPEHFFVLLEADAVFAAQSVVDVSTLILR